MCAIRGLSSEQSGEKSITAKKSIDPVAIIGIVCYDGVRTWE